MGLTRRGARVLPLDRADGALRVDRPGPLARSSRPAGGPRAALLRAPPRRSPTTCSSSTRSTSARAGSRRCASGPGCRATSRSLGRLREHGPWTNAELRGARRRWPSPGSSARTPGHELMGLYARGAARPRPLPGRAAARSTWSTRRSGSAERLAELLAEACRFFDDRGFYKRAQIVPSDLALAGVAEFDDLDRLTIFADNLVPHVLRVDGVLRYDPALAARIDAGELLPPGPEEREIRACAVHACELIAERLRRRRRACSTSGSGTAARRPSTRRSRGTARGPSTTESTRASAAASPRRALSRRPSPCRAAAALQAPDLGALGLAARLLGHQLLELGEAVGEAADRVGDRVGQVRPVGVGPCGLRRPRGPGGRDCRPRWSSAARRGSRPSSRRSSSPRPPRSGRAASRPAPIITSSPTVGWRLPRAKPVPPSVTPWYIVTWSPTSAVSPITTPAPWSMNRPRPIARRGVDLDAGHDLA